VRLDDRLLTLVATVDSPGGGHSRFQQRVLLPGEVDGGGRAIVVLTNGFLRVSVPRADIP
jgi:HSP20 family molecular chaperone IbpA